MTCYATITKLSAIYKTTILPNTYTNIPFLFKKISLHNWTSLMQIKYVTIEKNSRVN
jgi:hypothetical protein